MLATLHDINADTPACGFDELRAPIICLQPENLCREDDPADLRELPAERVKAFAENPLP